MPQTPCGAGRVAGLFCFEHLALPNFGQSNVALARNYLRTPGLNSLAKRWKTIFWSRSTIQDGPHLERKKNSKIGMPGCYFLILLSLQCDGGIGTDVMYQELYNKTTTKIVILGCGCSVSTQPTAQASHLWNLVQVCAGCDG